MIELENVARLTKDEAKAAATLGRDEAKYIVLMYYSLQKNRIENGNRAKILTKEGKPHETMAWIATQMETLENQIKRALDKYTNADELSVWAKGQKGIGPVISAALSSMIEPEKFETAGNLNSYAGLAPGQKRKRGEKCNWNSELKRILWLLGESFVKVSGYDDAFYGKLYLEKKAYYEAKNESGGFADRAKEILASSKWGDNQSKKALEAGRLPQAQIHAMAKRFAVKIFLSHYWQNGRELKGLPVPRPYAIEHMGHAHEIRVPD